MTGFWEVWTTVMLWGGAILCTVFAFVHMFNTESRRAGLPTLFLTVALLCLLQLGVIPR